MQPGGLGVGGPWIKPAQSMQKLVCVKTNLLGASHFSGPLPQLPGFVPGQDVAVLAFPTLVGDGARYPGPAPKVTASTMTGFDGANLIDDDIRTFAVLPSPSAGKPEYLQLEYAHPFKAALLNLAGAPGDPQEFARHLDISDDGHHFRQVREFRSLTNGLTLVFEASAARFYRVLFAAAQPEHKQLRFSHVDLCPIYRIEWAQAKSGLGLMPPGSTESSSSVSEFPSWARIQPQNLLDLTTNLSQNGQLDWNVPTGQWTVLRFSYEPTIWKPPFEVDVTANAHPGPNSLEIQVVNLWPNRLIGDEQLPEDCEWQTPSNAGAALVKWPAWLLEGNPSPTGRITFATWKHWTKDSPLLESGLLGPVTLHCLHSTDF